MKLKPREIWKTHPEFTDYDISSSGRIKRNKPYIAGCGVVKQPRILKPQKDGCGYHRVTVSNKKVYRTLHIHRLVLETFICPRPKNLECNHKDGNKKNNCLYNLEWTTKSKNQKHAYENGLQRRGEKHGNAKLKDNEVWLMKKLMQAKTPRFIILKMFKTNRETYRTIKNGTAWKHISYTAPE